MKKFVKQLIEEYIAANKKPNYIKQLIEAYFDFDKALNSKYLDIYILDEDMEND